MEWVAWRHVTVQNNIIHLCFHRSTRRPGGGGGRGVKGKGRKGGGGVRGKKKMQNRKVWANVWGDRPPECSPLTLNTSTSTGKEAGPEIDEESNIFIKQSFGVKRNCEVKLFLDQRETSPCPASCSKTQTPSPSSFSFLQLLTFKCRCI